MSSNRQKPLFHSNWTLYLKALLYRRPFFFLFLGGRLVASQKKRLKQMWTAANQTTGRLSYLCTENERRPCSVFSKQNEAAGFWSQSDHCGAHCTQMPH